MAAWTRRSINLLQSSRFPSMLWMNWNGKDWQILCPFFAALLLTRS